MDTALNIPAKKPFHQAVEEYDGLSKLWRKLMPFKEGIAELRRKKVSYATIARLLKDEGVEVSYRTVARFHRQFITVELRSRRRKRAVVPLPTVDQERSAKTPEKGTVSAMLQERRDKLIGPWTPRRRGPRIADAKTL
jgi:hypothetical protein